MNREKEEQLPMMQVNFIDTICLPIYEVRTVHACIVWSVLNNHDQQQQQRQTLTDLLFCLHVWSNTFSKKSCDWHMTGMKRK